MMLKLLWLIPTLPLLGFIFLAMVGARMPRRAVSFWAIGPVAVSSVLSVLISVIFVVSRPAGDVYSQSLGTWFTVSGVQTGFGLYLDALSLVMMTVVAVVGLLILIYSLGFMAEDDGYSRFFAYMNLFIASMLILLLADNFLLLYLGWEGVGVCSYLLIGFWYQKPENCRAAIKAFLVTRIGDTIFAIALLMFFVRIGTLGIQPVLEAVTRLPAGSVFCTVSALFLLGGAIGKSAQLPLQVWLPDAMAGPTPVSALIHAATMVTAGVYLIARTHPLFLAASGVMQLVAVIGAVTLLLAGFSAMVQTDIKRILAYSTISQIGYMFLALGAGAWAAAIYHFVTHALFKSALFLGAGAVIMAMNGEHNIFKMGGFRKQLPMTFRAFTAASLTLAAIPPLTLTFNSKDLILNTVWQSSGNDKWLWIAGLLGAFLTAIYAFRLLYVLFFGEMITKPAKKPMTVMLVPFSILALLAALSGLPELINNFFGIKTFYAFLQTALPEPAIKSSLPAHGAVMQIIYASVSLIAIGLTYAVYRFGRKILEAKLNTIVGSCVHVFLKSGFGFDWVYQQLIVCPFVYAVRLNRRDVLNVVPATGILVCRASHWLLSKTVNGNLRWYIAGIGIGAVILLGMVILL